MKRGKLRSALRVLHTIDTTGPGGAETVFLNLLKGLDSHRFQSYAAIGGPGWVLDTLRDNGIEPFIISTRGGFNLRYLMDLIAIIKRQRIDIVQSHLLGSNLYCSMAGLLCHVPVVSVFHGFVDSNENERLAGLKKRVIDAGSSRIVYVSETLREHFETRLRFRRDKSTVIHNGIALSGLAPRKDDTIRRELGIGPREMLVGALGNIRPAKGYDLYLKAARLVCDQHPDTRFLIAGEGSGPLYDNLVALRNQLQLDKVFHFIGYRDNISEVLNALDIFVLPSLNEGFSIATIEAMACGLPVVVTRSGGPEEIVVDGVNGLLVGCRPSAIADGILNYLHNVVARKQIAAKAVEHVNNKFGIDRMVDKYMDCYRYCCGF